MRIITGKAKGLRLKTIEHPALKPIDDKVKGAIFNILTRVVAGKSVCDLFAGSGAIGLEALSRGAAQVCFVEKRREFAPMLRENIEKLRGEDQCELWLGDVFEAIQGFHQKGRRFDLVFVDPPYFDRVWVDAKGCVHQFEIPRRPKEEEEAGKSAKGETLPQMVLNFLDKYPILNRSGWAVIRTYRRVPLSTENLKHLRPTRQEKYGEAMLTFFTTKE